MMMRFTLVDYNVTNSRLHKVCKNGLKSVKNKCNNCNEVILENVFLFPLYYEAIGGYKIVKYSI
jgi:hypothetical protein